MNGQPVIVAEHYCEQKHNKVPQIYVTSKINRTIYTQTEKVDIDEDNESIETIIEKMERTGAATRMTIVMTKCRDVSPCCRKFYLYPFCSLLFVV